MYQTNLCYTQFVWYMNFLLKKGFLEIKSDNPYGRCYQTTKKGQHFLNDINTVFAQVKD